MEVALGHAGCSISPIPPHDWRCTGIFAGFRSPAKYDFASTVSCEMPDVVVAVGRAVRIFRTVGAAERAIDPRDAASGIIQAWDDTGRRLRCDLGDAVCLDAARVSLTLDAGTTAGGALQAVLGDHLDCSGVARRAEASVAELLRLAIAREGYSG